MPTSENTSTLLAEEVTRAINDRLRSKKLSKKWLANMMKTDYGRIKRILNSRDSQQLSIEEADIMLTLLGSSLRDVLIAPVIESLQMDITNSLIKYKVSWR